MAVPRNKIRLVDKDNRYNYYFIKAKNVKTVRPPGNSGSLWNTLKVPKDVNITNIPSTVYKNEDEIPE